MCSKHLVNFFSPSQRAKLQSKMAATTAGKKPVAKGKQPSRKLTAVPESNLKFSKKQVSKRATLIKRKLKRSAGIALRKRENLVYAEKYQAKYLHDGRHENKLRRLAKKRGPFYVPAEDKLAFVICIRGINKVAPKVAQNSPETIPILNKMGNREQKLERIGS